MTISDDCATIFLPLENILFLQVHSLDLLRLEIKDLFSIKITLFIEVIHLTIKFMALCKNQNFMYNMTKHN